jgi:photosystem II stability/assembly factor-like uncharacterized protein
MRIDVEWLSPLARGAALPVLIALGAGCAGDTPEPGGSIPGVEPGGPAAGPSQRARRAPRLTPQTSGTAGRLQAVSPVSSRVVWASGVGGTYALTTDGGDTWQARVVPGAENLEFRDVEGVSERVAYLMAAGTGDASRIYKTEDGGATWTLQFQNQDPNGFIDCFAFWGPRRGLTMADASGGRLPVLRTTDGQSWQDIGDRLPPAQAGEAAFAASGTCVATQGARRAWIATGAAARARVLATTDGGDTWASYDTPVVQGTPSSGGFSIAFRDRRHGVLGAGELAAPTEPSDNFARSRDGGRTWRLATRTPFPGAIFGLAYAIRDDHHGHGGHDARDDGDLDGELDDDEPVADADDEAADRRGGQRDRVVVVATGPGGAAWTPDEGDTWFALEGVTNYWAVAFASRHTGWLVGTEGRILKIEL